MGNILHLDQCTLAEGQLFDPVRFDRPDLGLAVKPSFSIGLEDKIFVMGSCFAAEVRRTLDQRGFQVTDADQSYKYSTFSMLQALRWAFEDGFDVSLMVELEDGTWFDGHRHPFHVFESAEAGVKEHLGILANVREAVAASDVVVLTLGLVEVWRDRATGMWLNQTPPLRRLRDPRRFHMVQTSHAQNLTALGELLALLYQVNPTVRVVCSVSPVPLKATFSGEDVLVENCYSKSTLRSVVTEAIRGVRGGLGLPIDYFPAYELVTLNPREKVWQKLIRGNEPDGRHVLREFVDQVILKLFLERYLDTGIESACLTVPEPCRLAG